MLISSVPMRGSVGIAIECTRPDSIASTTDNGRIQPGDIIVAVNNTFVLGDSKSLWTVR
eukprot:m.657214 g.657214  ORF g.657214 m.657214 type:complete len:59 (+) comp22710_c0_seq4:1993-2169(+)